MLYMVSLEPKNLLAQASAEAVRKFKAGFQAGKDKGIIKAAYSKVGGGLILIIDSPSNASLTINLREHHITDAEVVPLVDFMDVVDAYIEHKETGAVKK
ncbi:hypothetical protein [Ottowia thiooxydans]|uniref:hypothetical protein n=1 Tax=Ottowia thiooxydans TaxID=219182 RepID=UPI0003F74CA7|nr:hypothetical protein [Ottowia thiooxydans]